VPVMVTDTPTAPELRDKRVMLGTACTVNDTPALATPLTVTTTLPVVAPAGTGATIAVALQLVGLALVALKATVLVPWVEPKLVPVMVTDAPTAPEVGVRLVMLGVGTTVNDKPLLDFPPPVTTTFPVVAPEGTRATIEVALPVVGLALVALKLTVLVPWVEPKLVPVIVTDVPTAPEVGDKAVILGEAAFSWSGEKKITRSVRTPEMTRLRAARNINADLSFRFARPKYRKDPLTAD